MSAPRRKIAFLGQALFAVLFLVESVWLTAHGIHHSLKPSFFTVESSQSTVAGGPCALCAAYLSSGHVLTSRPMVLTAQGIGFDRLASATGTIRHGARATSDSRAPPARA